MTEQICLSNGQFEIRGIAITSHWCALYGNSMLSGFGYEVFQKGIAEPRVHCDHMKSFEVAKWVAIRIAEMLSGVYLQ